MIFGLDSDAFLIGAAFGVLVGSLLTEFLFIERKPPTVLKPEPEDTVYDFCPRPGCTMADIHRDKLK